MIERLPFRIFRVVEREPVPVFKYVTTVVAPNESVALRDFQSFLSSTDQVFVAQAWNDHGPPKLIE
jgi:hypothetical protein